MTWLKVLSKIEEEYAVVGDTPERDRLRAQRLHLLANHNLDDIADTDWWQRYL